MTAPKLGKGVHAKRMKAWAKRGEDVIRMYEKEDKTFGDIAKLLGVTPQRVHRLYHNAKAREQ